jgi:myosin-5
MLEKSRVVTLSANERNYHIFYQMIKGVTDARLMELALERECDEYRYLAASGCYEVPHVDDAADYQEVLRSLESFNLGGDFTEGLECTLAAILHIGNVSFGSTENSDNALFEDSESTIAYAAGLLGVDVDAFKQSLTKRRMTVVGETIMVDLRVEQAMVCRDSLAKQLYSTSFDMLVEALAEALAGNNAAQNEQFIGVLDIFGFEIFTLNTLEQFNINYANEMLQSYFNDDVFTREIAMYKREGVSVEHFDFKDNKQCVELIEGRAGMINLLNEECSLGDAGTGKSYLNKVSSFTIPYTPPALVQF